MDNRWKKKQPKASTNPSSERFIEHTAVATELNCSRACTYIVWHKAYVTYYVHIHIYRHSESNPVLGAPLILA